MNDTLTMPCLADGGILFRVSAGFSERECIISRNALAHLGRSQSRTMDFMHIYKACETRIHKVARRMIVAGESASPLVLGAAYFVDDM